MFFHPVSEQPSNFLRNLSTKTGKNQLKKLLTMRSSCVLLNIVSSFTITSFFREVVLCSKTSTAVSQSNFKKELTKEWNNITQQRGRRPPLSATCFRISCRGMLCGLAVQCWERRRTSHRFVIVERSTQNTAPKSADTMLSSQTDSCLYITNKFKLG
jgi:hypothetical protein